MAIVALGALFFTYSRGGWLVAAVSLGLLGLFSLRQHFLRTSIYAAWCLGAGAVAVVVALRWTNTFGFFALLAVALVAGAVPMLKLRLNSKLARSLLVGGLVAAAAAVGVALYAQRLFLQERLAWALQRFDLTVMAQDGRLVFFRDGLSVLYQSPLIGHGGGAWRALYVRVQSFHYGSARMHSDPLEILLETGLLGVVAYAIWLGVPLWYGMKSKNKLHQGVAFALVGFLLHSSIDAFLGFPVFYYILAVLLAVTSPRTPVFRLKMPALLAASGKTLVTVCLSVILLVTGMLWLSEAEERWGVQPAVARNDHAGVTESLRRAVLMNPFESRRRIDYFRMLEQTGATRASLEAQLELAARFEPHDPRVTNTIGNFYLARRDFAAALRYFNRSLEQQPMNIQNYESLAFAYLLAATDAAAAGRPVGGYLEGVLAVQERFSATVVATEPRLLAQSALAFVSTPLMEATKGGRLVLLGDVNEAVTVLEKQQLVGDAVAREVAVAWLARAYQLLGRTAAAEALIAKQGDAESFRQYLAQVRAATVER
ncbi:MAG: hypothetical protein DDT39_01655 [Firmicutes bacterium]|nr:hypothetical protein [candidate division NPL-UPA2 bacterium]